MSLPEVQLPETGEILHYLLTFVFPKTPIIPPIHEEVIKFLSMAQNYQMGVVLTYIWGSIALWNPLPNHLEPALHIYSLVQKYELKPEVLQTTRNILQHLMTVENFNNMLNFMFNPSLYELSKYHGRVQAIFTLDLTEFSLLHMKRLETCNVYCIALPKSQVGSVTTLSL